MNAKRQAWLVYSLLFLSAFFLYAKTLCSSLYVDDSGETATLAWTLSIGHPPGYPLHTLLARIFCFLPLGDAALRVNGMAAFLGALCAPLSYALARRMAGPLSSLLAPVLICLGPVFWHNALVAKGTVYMLNNALTLGALLCLFHDKRRLFFLLFGLGLAHHYMSQAVMIPCYALLLRKDFKALPWALPGLSLYLFFFIRAAQNPPINWGEIRSFNDFVFFLSRAQYAAGEGSRTLVISAIQLWTALKYLVLEGHVFAIGLACLAWQRKALVAGLLAPLAAVTVYLNLQGDRLTIMEPYLFPAYLCQALLAAAGLKWLLESRLKYAAFLVASLALMTPQNLSGYFFALDNARNVLQSLPKNAVLFSSGDAIIFPIWYLQNVKHERRDVALVGTPVLPMDWVRNDLHRRYPEIFQPRIPKPIGAESIDRLVYTLLEMNKGRLPLYFSYNQLNAGVPNWRLAPEGPVYRAEPLASAENRATRTLAEKKLMACVLRNFERRDTDERTLKLVVGDQAIHHNALGIWLEDRKDYPGALEHFMAAKGINPASEEFPFNIGNVKNEMDQKEESLSWYQRSLELNPRYESAWFNLAATNFMLNHTAEGCAALKKTLEINPASQSALAQKGRCPNLQ